MDEIGRGAEAVVYRDGDRIVKDREPKRYRHPALDERLRTERTEREARLLQKAQQVGVPVPDVLEIDTHTLTVARIDGTPLRQVLEEELARCSTIGEHIGQLHRHGIIHGDLTTSNMLLADGTVHLIDFGLGFFSDRVEDRAVDLHLLQEVLDSTHTDIAERAMEDVLDGYRETAEDVEAVLDRFDEVEGRGRYR